MATAVLPFRPTLLRPRINAAAAAAADDRNRKASSPKWWSPLFGFSSEPDYLNQDPDGKHSRSSRSERSRFAPGTFTEEKARQLRRMNGGTSSFHDSMYHSAIASRMASDFSDLTADVKG